MSDYEAEASAMSMNSTKSISSERGSVSLTRRPSLRGKRRHRDARADVDDWGKTEQEAEAAVDEFQRHMIAEGVVRKYGEGQIDNRHKLLRFLRAREYDLPKATQMYFDHLKWRREQDVDSIIKDFVFKEREAFLGVYPQGYYKTDKQGRPVSIQHLGTIDLKKIKEVTTTERMVKYHIQEYERFLSHIAPVCSRVAGRHIDKTFAILDVKGVTLRMLTGDVRKMLAEITKIDQDHYPETLGKTCIINAPFVFKAVWAIVKPMLQPRTVAKVTLLGTKYMDELVKYIDIDNIPTYLGGRSKETLLDDAGPWNDEKVLSSLNKIEEDSSPGDRGVVRAHHELDSLSASPSSLVRASRTHDAADLEPADMLQHTNSVFEAAQVARPAEAVTVRRADASASQLPGPIAASAPLPAATPRQSPANLTRRLQALEEKLRMLQGGAPVLDQVMRSSPQSLLARVEQLEYAATLLVDAQEAALAERPQSRGGASSHAKAGDAKAEDPPKAACGCCCIM